MNVRVVIFDWDGTLVDSVEHIADSLHQAATELGYPAWSERPTGILSALAWSRRWKNSTRASVVRK